MKAQVFSALVRGLARSWRVRLQGELPVGPCVVAFWHGEMLPVLATFGPLHSVVLVSPSDDGKLLQHLLRDWGHTIVQGSSSRGGKQALEQLVALAPSNIILITPDGPRGPAMKSKAGAVITAHRSGVPLVLVRVRATPTYTFARSWDRFQLPLPFAHITLHVSTPIHLPLQMSEQEVSREIELLDQRMQSLGSVQC